MFRFKTVIAKLRFLRNVGDHFPIVVDSSAMCERLLTKPDVYLSCVVKSRVPHVRGQMQRNSTGKSNVESNGNQMGKGLVLVIAQAGFMFLRGQWLCLHVMPLGCL